MIDIQMGAVKEDNTINFDPKLFLFVEKQIVGRKGTQLMKEKWLDNDL